MDEQREADLGYDLWLSQDAVWAIKWGAPTVTAIPVPEPSESPDSVADLRARIAELTAQIESLTPKPVPEKPKFPFALTQPNNDIRMGAARYMVE